jgi:hypothetical protein
MEDAAMTSPATPPPDAQAAPPPAGFRINEDWAATLVGLVLLALVIGGVIVKGMIP